MSIHLSPRDVLFLRTIGAADAPMPIPNNERRVVQFDANAAARSDSEAVKRLHRRMEGMQHELNEVGKDRDEHVQRADRAEVRFFFACLVAGTLGLIAMVEAALLAMRWWL